jgi:glycosyltransferase involved in cell wall biosynthesis
VSSSKKKIFYISLIEDPINNGIIKSQVINVLKAAVVAGHAVSFFSSPSRVFFSRHDTNEISDFQNDLKSGGIKFYCTPIPIVSNACIRTILIPFLIAYELPIIIFRILKEKPDIIHCRSYPASLLGLIAKIFTRKKLIFDMRGVYPEEGNFLFPSWHKRSINFRAWKKLEKLLLLFSDKIIVVSNEFKHHVNCITKNSIPPEKISTVICGTPQVLSSTDFSREAGLPIKIVYSGTIDGWTSPELLAEIYNKIIIKNPTLQLHLNIYTNTPADKIKTAFDGACIPSHRYSVASLKSKDVPSKLAENDLSLLVRENSIVNNVSFPVKISEYIAAGTPILTNRHIKGGQEFILQSQTGISLEDNDFSLSELVENIAKYRNNCKNALPDLNKSAADYLEIYAKL